MFPEMISAQELEYQNIMKFCSTRMIFGVDISWYVSVGILRYLQYALGLFLPLIVPPYL